MILLDIMMPVSGLEICQMIREQITVPICFITAKDMAEDLVAGINAARLFKGEEAAIFPRKTAIGSLAHYTPMLTANISNP